MMRDEIRFALDSLLVNRRRMVLTVAIIAVGVASLVGIQTAVSILADEVAGSLGRAGAGLFTLQAQKEAPPISYRQAKSFCEMSRAASVWSVVKKQAQLRSGGVTTDPVVRVLACDENYLACQDLRLAAGRGFTLREVEERLPVALIGDNVRKKLFGNESGLGEMLSCGSGRYRVVGVLAREGALYGSSLDASMLVPIDASAADCRISVRVPETGSLSAAVAEAGAQLAAVRRLPPGREPDFEIAKAEGAEATLASLRSKLSLLALAIGLVTMLGASVGLMNSLLVSVKQRTQEIGTRRALGARARSISRQFLLESVVIGQMGNASGVLLGLLFGGLTALALGGCFSVPWPWLGAATLLSLAVSLAAGVLPARRAARLNPVEALRSL
ncbi:MAG: ABC transporter permease [Bacteroidales bacterium]|nr:ABC transporter permease [Bacteroidales bacterium]